MQTTFDDLGLNPQVLRAVQELGFESPTPIQEKAIPYLLQSKGDLVAFAQTGTGKTAAFGLPVIQQVDSQNPQTQMLALCPTRELCLQITKELTNYSKYIPGLRVVAVYGGAEISKQINELKQGAHIVVGTPGRALDLINRRKLLVDHIQWLVLDEADEMLSMGFKDELDAILGTTPAEKQTLLFSATMPAEMTAISKKYMHNPAEISAGKKNVGAENVQHHFYMVQARDKYLALKRIADYYPDIYGIVFCRTRQETKEVADKLMEDGYNADALHGDLSQVQRDYVMQRFRLKQLQILVATDVAARGLDVNSLSHVINYSLPDDPEVYIHRSGRTGRAGKSGISILLANMREKGKLGFIEKKIGKRFDQKPVPNGRDICEKQLFHMIGRIENIEIKDAQIEQYLPSIYARLSWMSREDLIQRFVSVEFNHFLSYYKNAPDLNVEVSTKRNDRERGADRERGSDRERGGDRERGKFGEGRGQDKGNFVKIFFNLGKKDEITAKSLIEIINKNTRGKSLRIGRIELSRNYSLVEIEPQYQDMLVNTLNGVVYNNIPLQVRSDRKK